MQQATPSVDCRPDIVTAVVTGYEKRKYPSKHYVFVVTVVWSNNERFEIYRRYNDFFSLQEVLKSAYPESMKTIPSLPKRIIFGRSNIARVAEARLDTINKYCQSLINMDPTIAQGTHVLCFFNSHTGDKKLPNIGQQRLQSLHPLVVPSGSLFEEHYLMEDFTAQDKSELTVKLGDCVIVMARDPSGWCMCQKDGKTGWLPLSYLRRGSFVREDDVLGFLSNMPDGKDADLEVEVETETYRAIESYEAQGPGQVSFKDGDLITVLDKMEDGWWFVSKEEVEGWAPSSYLETLRGIDEQDQNPTQVVSEQLSYVAKEAYTAENEDEVTFPKNAVLSVTHRSLDGWWQATYEGHTGLVPSSLLVPFGEQLNVTQLSQEEWVPKQRYSQPPRRQSIKRHKQKQAAIPAIIVEQPTLTNPDTAGRGTSSGKQRPRSVHITSQANENTGTDASKKKAYTRHSPTSAPPHHSFPPSEMRRPRSQSCLSKHGGSDPTTMEPSPSSQQLAEMMVKFILASDNPDLRAALKKAIESDPKGYQ